MSKDSPSSPNAVQRSATALVQRLIDVGIDGLGPLDPAVQVAEEARAKTGSADEAIDRIVRSHTRLAAGGGFLSGLGGFVTLAVALPAGVAGFYVVATRVVAATAHLRGHDLTSPDVRSAVLLVLTDTDPSTVLAKAGLSPARYARNFAIKQLPPEALMVVNKAIGQRLLTQAGGRGLAKLGRGVPVAGGLIGAGSDWRLLRRIARKAQEAFPATAAAVGVGPAGGGR